MSSGAVAPTPIYLQSCVLSSPAFLGSCGHTNISMWQPRNLQCLRPAYDTDQATPWYFHNWYRACEQCPLPASATPSVFRTSYPLSVLWCVHIILKTLLLVTYLKTHLLSPDVYVTRLCIDRHDECCSSTLALHGYKWPQCAFAWKSS